MYCKTLLLCLLFLLLSVVSCGERTLRTLSVYQIDTGSFPVAKLEYKWQENDSWTFLAWAIMDDPDAAQVLALGSGKLLTDAIYAGETVLLPLDPSLEDALLSRLESARLLQNATEAYELGDLYSTRIMLEEAINTDPEWSIPCCNLAVLYIEDGDRESAFNLLEPVSHKFKPALMLSKLYWEMGNTTEATHLIETALMQENCPTEVLAAAAIIYTVSGKNYNASMLWRHVLADPDASVELRMLAVKYALIHELRQE